MEIELTTVIALALYWENSIGVPDCRKIISQLPTDNLDYTNLFKVLVTEYQDKWDEDEDIYQLEACLWRATDLLFHLHKQGISVIGCMDKRYPTCLRDLEDYPVLLFVKGNLDALYNPHKIAIVGTREPSEYGMRIARKLGTRFAEKRFIVVSGLARGCDTQAHWGCIEAGCKTIAVLAHGFDTVYPEENRDLADAIIATGGCLISEYLPPEEPVKKTFIERDRIQAALSKAVIVVESDIDGATMHTAKYAIDLKRKLGCIGYRPYAEGTEGAKMTGNDFLVSEGKAVRLVETEDMEKFLRDIS